MNKQKVHTDMKNENQCNKSKQLNKEKIQHTKKPDQKNQNGKRKNVYIVGNSMSNAIEEKRLSTNKNIVKVKNHPGATSEDIIDHLRPIIRKKTRYDHHTRWYKRPHQ